MTGLRREATDFPIRLFDLLRGPHHTLLVSGGASVDAVALNRRCGGTLRAYRVIDPESGTDADSTPPTLTDADGHFRRLYGSGPAVSLIRPDGYIGFRDGSHSRLDDYLNRVFQP